MRGGGLKLWEEKNDSINEGIDELLTKLFVEQPLVLPGSSND